MRASRISATPFPFLTGAMLLCAASWPGSLAAATPTLYEQLVKVNRNWAYVGPEKRARLQTRIALEESELLKKHLELVEYWLRKEPPTGLTPAQKTARARNLQYLHEYWTTQASPRNYTLPYRNPIFIDQGDRVCAVGYLVVRGGREDLARSLSKLDNKIYIREIQSPEFEAWARDSGLTIDELAWIQPAYGPEDVQEWEPVGQSLQGEVRTFVQEDSGRMYAGGNLQIRGSKKGPVNLAYSERGTWHPLGKGVNGQVDAILPHEGRVYVGGAFTEAGGRSSPFLAIWDTEKETWIPQKARFDGRVRSFAVFHDTVFVGGDFQHIGAAPVKYLARWDAEKKIWVSAGSPNAQVSGLTVFADKLVATGAFREMDGKGAQFAASFDGKKREPMGTGLPQPVAVSTTFEDSLVFGNYIKKESKAEGSGEKTCRLVLPAWTGKEWKEISASAEWECAERPPVIGAMVSVGDTITIGLRDSGMLRFVVRYGDTLHMFGGNMGDTFTGLSKIRTLVSSRGRLFIGGIHDKKREHYTGGSDIVSGKNVALFYEFRSALNRIDYSRITEDTMYTPFRALNGIKDESDQPESTKTP